jgi:hypothetical protein
VAAVWQDGGGCTGNETIQGLWSPSWNGNLDTAGPRSISLMGQKITSLQFILAEEEGEDDAKSMLGCAWMIGASDKKGCTWARSQRSSDVRLLGRGSLHKNEDHGPTGCLDAAIASEKRARFGDCT